MSLRRSLTVAAAALASTFVLSACGFGVATNQVYQPGVGTDERSSRVDVLGAVLVSDSDGAGTLVAGLVNNREGESDRLTGVGGPGMNSDAAFVEIPPGGFVQLVEDPITVRGERIVPGNFVEVTFTFENAEPITTDLPVVTPTDEYAEVPTP